MNNILDLSGYEIVDRQETEHDIRFTVECGTMFIACPHCGSMQQPYRHGVVVKTVMDLPIRAKRVGLAINVQRLKCKDCEGTFMQNLAWLDMKRAATIRLVQYIEKESLKRTFTSLADEIGITEGTIRNIFKTYVRRLDATVKFETPEWLGLDELKLMKKTRGMVTNVKERTVIEMLPKRDLPFVLQYLRSLPNKQRIQVVTMDMWKPYRQAVREVLPDAQIVVDKFHVVRMATDAVDAVRKDIRKGLTDRQRRTLMHDRFLLLKRERELKPHQIIKRDAWFGSFPLLHLAYEMKEEFYDLWDAQTGQEAAALYDAWVAKMPSDLAGYFTNLTGSISRWRKEIFAHFDYGHATNAYTEAVNGLAKLIARNGRGYSFEAVRAKVLYGNGLKMNARPKYKKNKEHWAYEIIVGPKNEPEEFTSLGNEISTLAQHIKKEGL